MLAGLSLGILQVREIIDRPDAFYLLEGGFVRVTENHVTILAYDAVTFEGMEKDQIKNFLSQAQNTAAGQDFIQTPLGKVDAERSRLLVRMAGLAGIEAEPLEQSQ
jgi:F0F1-type ATP synthase epsilon subunit